MENMISFYKRAYQENNNSGFKKPQNVGPWIIGSDNNYQPDDSNDITSGFTKIPYHYKAKKCFIKIEEDDIVYRYFNEETQQYEQELHVDLPKNTFGKSFYWVNNGIMEEYDNNSEKLTVFDYYSNFPIKGIVSSGQNPHYYYSKDTLEFYKFKENGSYYEKLELAEIEGAFNKVKFLNDYNEFGSNAKDGDIAIINNNSGQSSEELSNIKVNILNKSNYRGVANFPSEVNTLQEGVIYKQVSDNDYIYYIYKGDVEIQGDVEVQIPIQLRGICKDPPIVDPSNNKNKIQNISSSNFNTGSFTNAGASLPLLGIEDNNIYYRQLQLLTDDNKLYYHKDGTWYYLVEDNINFTYELENGTDFKKVVSRVPTKSNMDKQHIYVNSGYYKTIINFSDSQYGYYRYNGSSWEHLSNLSEYNNEIYIREMNSVETYLTNTVLYESAADPLYVKICREVYRAAMWLWNGIKKIGDIIKNFFSTIFSWLKGETYLGTEIEFYWNSDQIEEIPSIPMNQLMNYCYVTSQRKVFQYLNGWNSVGTVEETPNSISDYSGSDTYVFSMKDWQAYVKIDNEYKKINTVDFKYQLVKSPNVSENHIYFVQDQKACYRYELINNNPKWTLIPEYTSFDALYEAACALRLVLNYKSDIYLTAFKNFNSMIVILNDEFGYNFPTKDNTVQPIAPKRPLVGVEGQIYKEEDTYYTWEVQLGIGNNWVEINPNSEEFEQLCGDYGFYFYDRIKGWMTGKEAHALGII